MANHLFKAMVCIVTVAVAAIAAGAATILFECAKHVVTYEI